VTSQKTPFFIVTAMKTSNLTQHYMFSANVTCTKFLKIKLHGKTCSEVINDGKSSIFIQNMQYFEIREYIILIVDMGLLSL
jgi:hypothetical protein